jgi:four helix bundle protein
MQSFRNLKVWEKAHILTLDVYKSSKGFPRDELYGLTSQMRRSSASIGANIAEDVAEKVTSNWDASCKLRWGQPVSWSTNCSWHAT